MANDELVTSRKRALWERYQRARCEALGITIDLSRLELTPEFLAETDSDIRRALSAMAELESGAIANPDENRRVGHYWLRAPDLAPEPAITATIVETFERIREFARAIRSGVIRPESAPKFRHALVVGIGGSALGPQLADDALGTAARAATGSGLRLHFLDNTDPDGFDRVFASIGDELDATLVLVISKSGGTKETRNGMLESEWAFERANLDFAKHAVAVTGEGSALDRLAEANGWLARFPMWDWVGGRTSETAAVGLLPAALAGIDLDEFLAGAREMDVATREADPRANPAAMLALAWYRAVDGRGAKDMVVLPYKDRLILLSRYLQQLVMESLGKEKDLDGVTVHQGISVYGNKGATDQHSYVQQLRDGVHNFFVVFIEVEKDRAGKSREVEPGITSGDFLFGFFLGTRDALHEKGRESITITLPEVSPRTLGAVIALFERTVGLYASLVNINAYHQPGVQAGKTAAARVLDLQRESVAALLECAPRALTADEIAATVGAPDDAETIYRALVHLAANGRDVRREPGNLPLHDRFSARA